MSYDSHGQYGSDPQYPQYPQPQGPQYSPAPQPPQSPQYPPTNPYPQTPAYGTQPGGNDPTAPIVPSYGGSDPYAGSNPPYGGGGQPPYGGGAYPAGGGGQYGAGGGDPYSGAPYGQDPYGGAAPSSGWPAPPGSVPPGSVPPYGPPPRKSRTGLTIGLVAGGVALVLCLGAAAILGTQLLSDDEPGTNDPVDLADPPSPGSEDPDNSGDPFADTPAANFAVGADGIQLPEAEAVGDFSAEEVEETLGLVKDAMIATRMDETMLLDHNPDPFIDSMSPDSQDDLRRQFDEGSFAYFATQIADDAELAVPEPRVDGTITYEATTDTSGFRVIEVVTSFVWAYAFVPPNDDPELSGVVVVRDELVWQVAHADDVADSSLGLWLWNGEAAASGIDCAAFDQGLLAPQSEVELGFGEEVDEDQLYDPEGSLDIPDNC